MNLPLPPPGEDELRRSRRALWIRGAALGGVLLAAVGPRLGGLRLIFARGELLQWDPDSAYHLKRITHALAHFPDVLRFDPSMNWPVGAPCPWPDGFDLLAAAWGLLAGLGDPARQSMAVLLFTPLLALLAVWAAMDLARLMLPEGPAKEGGVIAAGLLTAFVPSAVHQSQVGFVDHHIAELLAFLLLAGWALRRLPTSAGGEHRVDAAWELGGALAATFASWVFAGGVLYVAIAFGIVLLALLREERPRLVTSGAPALLSAAILGALLAWPSVRAHGRVLSYQFPSLVQPLLVGVAGAVLGLAVLVGRRVRGPGRRLAVMAAAAVVLIPIGALALPGALHEVVAGLEGWLLRRDPWLAAVAEFQPFGRGDDPFVLALFKAFGALGVLAPFILAAGGWLVFRRAGPRGHAFLLLTAGFVLFTLNQVRFERIGQPLLMIMTAALFTALAQRRRAQGHPWAVRIFPILATVVLVLSDPLLQQVFRPRWFKVPSAMSAAIALADLGANPATDGVLATWDQGHYFNFGAGLPVVTNGFGSYLDRATFEESEQVFRKDAGTLDAFLARRRLRFVVAGTGTYSLSNVDGRGPLRLTDGVRGAVLDLDYMRSFGLAPLVIGGSAIPGAGVPHLPRLMPVFATREERLGVAFPLPALWVYERVPGARIVGTAPAGRRVVASLDFREQGRPHVWKAFAPVGEDGRFELVLPFPTGHLRPGLSSAPRYSLRVDDGPPTEVELPERLVRSGGTVSAGAVRAGSPTPTRPQAPATGSRTVKTAPPPGPLATEIAPPKDSAIP